MKLNYKWKMSDGFPAKGVTPHKGTVFSCFACGGGSTLGYKLAGFEVLGCNEIDPKMNKVYVENHKPKYNYLEPIQTFKLRKDLPEELYNLDILDGSPPCSSFSMAGNREKDWGKEKKFKEGQAEQVLDTLFFDFIDLAKELKPKVVVAENVKGITQGEAKKYMKAIFDAFDEAGYYLDYWLMDGSEMGIPQKRERVFFIAMRKDLADNSGLPSFDLFNPMPPLELDFNFKKITFDKVRDSQNFENEFSDYYKSLWRQRLSSDKDFSCINGRVNNKPNTGFGCTFAKSDKVCGTLTAKKDCYADFEEGRYLSTSERVLISSFPQDYNFTAVAPYYLIGMSVPPLMTARIANEIKKQWLDKL